MGGADLAGFPRMKDISAQDIREGLRLVTRSNPPRVVEAGGVRLGEGELVIIAGPCTVESRTQIFEIARAVKDAGARMLRGGVFKPMTFPYGDPLVQPDSDSGAPPEDRYQVLPLEERFRRAEKRLGYFKEAGEKYGLPIVSEVLHAAAVKLMEPYVDMFQVGYRHMFNMDLIEALSATEKPLLIKRHCGESLRALLGVGEHFEARGKRNFAFCERGVAVPHTHQPTSRSILDVQAICALKEFAPTVPVIADPSHSTFRRSYVIPMARAAVAAGADGLLVEVHPDPPHAWVDNLQALDFAQFREMVRQVEAIARVLGG